MPTLDDAPIIEELVASGTSDGSTVAVLLPISDSDAVTEISKKDLIQVFDVSEQKVKTISVEALAYSIASGPFA